MALVTRITRLLGIRHPLVQAGMSWASSSSALPAAVSAAGGLGVVAAGPMRADELRRTVREVRAATPLPFAVNVALYNKRAAEHLDVVMDERVPVVIASQGSPRDHVGRFRDAGIRWLHVVAHPEHARKAEAAGVDGLVVVGTEAGGHPPPSGTSTLVLVRLVAAAVRLPIVAGGGVADGFGLAATLALGADAAQLGTRFLLTPEASLHPAYKQKVLDAGVGGTTLVGDRRLPIRAVRNAFTDDYEAAERAGRPPQALEAMFAARSLRMAALDGDVEHGKVEAGQSAALCRELVPAAELVERIVQDAQAAMRRLRAMEQAA